MAQQKRIPRANTVLEVLKRHRNVEISVHDLADETGFDWKTVSGTISNLRKSTNIEVPRRGWYLYKGPKSPGKNGGMVTVKAKAQVVSMLNDGRLLVSVEGVLYIAEELEIA